MRRFLPILALILAGTLGFAPNKDYASGCLPSSPGDYPRAHVSQVWELPESIDLSLGLPPVGNQGEQASCVAWAIAYYYRSYQEGIERDRVPFAESEKFSPAFIYNQRWTNDCQLDWGMTALNGLRIAVQQGVASLKTMPYSADDTCSQPSDNARAEADLHRAESYANLFIGRGTANLIELKRHLATGDPFLLAFPASADLYLVTRDNVVIDLPDEDPGYSDGHMTLVIGYDDDTETFKFVNSWGTNWGDRGFGYLTYRFVREMAWEGWTLIDMDSKQIYFPIMLKGGR